jgi:hypothetical protein
MSHFAEIGSDNVVIRVIVAEQEFINSGAVGHPSRWKQTSYNTLGGVHLKGDVPIRKNYAGVGYTYDSARDAFIPPKPYESWLLNEETCLWEPPVQKPDDDKFYNWDEETLSWIEFTIEE